MTRVKEHCEKLASDNGVIITEAQLSRTLQKEIDRLTAENKKLQDRPDYSDLDAAVFINSVLEAKLKAKDKALLEYGNHRPSCNRYRLPSSCTCGWNYVLHTLKG